MAIIKELGANPNPPVIPLEQKQSRARMRINAQINSLYTHMLQVFNSSTKMMWENPAGLTPQQIFDAFGTEGAELLRLTGILRDAINTAVPGTITAAPPTHKIADDGTVLVGEKTVIGPVRQTRT